MPSLVRNPIRRIRRFVRTRSRVEVLFVTAEFAGTKSLAGMLLILR